MTTWWRTLKARLAYRLVVWAMGWAKSGWGRCANRVEATFTVQHRELFVRVRDLRKPDAYERTEVLRMLQRVRMSEYVQGWTCPDPGTPKQGRLICDGVPVDVLYFWEEPGLDDGPWELVRQARTIVGVTETGRDRVLKSRGGTT